MATTATTITQTSTNPAYSHTLLEFIVAGRKNQIMRYPMFCFQESLYGNKFVVDNILHDYYYELKRNCILVNLSDAEIRRYKYNPKKLAFDIYGYTDLYYIILLLNDMCDVREFDNIKTLYMMPTDALGDSLSKIYNAESANIKKYNSRHL